VTIGSVESHAVVDPLSPTTDELCQALERGELEAWYQPVVRLSDGVVTGFEALVRWRHPRLGLLPASAFVPLAEASGLIHVVDRWMRREVFGHVQRWQEDVLVAPGFRVVLHISAREMGDDGLAADISRAILDAGVDPHGLTLELTETDAIRDHEAVRRIASGVRDLGVDLALDDFGSPSATFELLRTLRFDVLKLDRAVVAASESNVGRAMVVAFVGLGRELRSTIVASGIETLDEAMRIRRLGCDEGQGFLWAPAVDVAEAELLLTTGMRNMRAGWRVSVTSDMTPMSHGR
jgi:EAL domain-containing protein (putative c-di-GMP-specific phosphodiesterase class I)